MPAETPLFHDAAGGLEVTVANSRLPVRPFWIILTRHLGLYEQYIANAPLSNSIVNVVLSRILSTATIDRADIDSTHQVSVCTTHVQISPVTQVQAILDWFAANAHRPRVRSARGLYARYHENEITAYIRSRHEVKPGDPAFVGLWQHELSKRMKALPAPVRSELSKIARALRHV